VAAGSIAYWRGDYPSVHRHYRQALDDARASEDRGLIAEALYNFSFAPTPTAGFAENVEPGLPVIAEALDLYRELGDRRGIANTTWLLGIGALTHSKAYEEAIRHFNEALTAYRELGNQFGAGWALHEKAIAEIYLGDLSAAERSAREALQIFAGTNGVSAAVLLLLDHALIAQRNGDHDRAWRLAGAADSLRQESGTDVAVLGGFGEIDMPVRPDAESDQDAARLWEEGASWQPERAIAFALREG
jgi:tetratricopeptide (TPR) repeat protein